MGSVLSYIVRFKIEVQKSMLSSSPKSNRQYKNEKRRPRLPLKLPIKRCLCTSYMKFPEMSKEYVGVSPTSMKEERCFYGFV